MLLIDSAAGSIDLPKIFPHELVTVASGLPADIIIPGKGEGGKAVTVGVEFKKIKDVLKCILDGRFAGTQLPRMLKEHEEVWLLIEGERRRGIQGDLQIPHPWKKGQWMNASLGSRRFSNQDYEAWMITMQTRTPLKIKEVGSRLETKDWVMAMHKWWAEQGWDKHRSHEVTDKSRARAILTAESETFRLKREVAETLPGIGHDKAKKVATEFWSVFDMMTADTGDWTRIEGIGQKMAERIVGAIHDEEERR